MTKSIGYQGALGSNSEIAAKEFAKDGQLLIPLVSSINIIEELRNGNIDYGVVVTYNSLGEGVEETCKTLKNVDIEIIDTIYLKIKHSLFKRRDVSMEELTCIASHPEALKETKNNRKTLYPNLSELETQDTAKSAEMLFDGIIPKTTAVLCGETIGDFYGLELIKDSMEDDKNNFIEFILFKLKE